MADILKITYGELRNNTYKELFSDPYGIVSGYLTDSVRNALLANPNLLDDSEIVLNVILDNKQAVGRNMLMPTRVLINGEPHFAHTGGSYEITESERGKGYGSLLFRESIMEESSIYIGQLYSSGAISILRKMNLLEINTSQFIRICKSDKLLEARGIHGTLLKISSTIFNCFIWLKNIRSRSRIKRLNKRYIIRKETIIPKWIDKIVLNDRKRFMEIHDRQWMQWNLDYSFSDNRNDSQAFYSICNKNGTPSGFFMIKVRHETNQGIYKSISKGTIVEWGSNSKGLSEVDINILACSMFDKSIDSITTVASSPKSVKEFKQMGFIRHGNYQMTVNVESQFGLCNPDQWRIRFGGCNTILI